MLHSAVLVSSLWRVLLITLSSLTDMPSLNTVSLDKRYAFSKKKTVHTKSSSSSSSSSFLDITPALQQYLQFIVSFTHHSHPNTKSPLSLRTTITLFLPHCHSFYYVLSHATKHSFVSILLLHGNSRDQAKCCIC